MRCSCCRSGTRAMIPILLFTALFVIPAISSPTEAAGMEDLEGAYLTEKEGFVYLQISGTPADMGYQHGSLLSDLITRAISAYAHATERSYGLTWDKVRNHGRTYWRLVPEEQKEEITGIAEGASQNGAMNPLGNPVDWVDILSLNAIWDIWWRAEPPGNPWWWLPFNNDLPRPESSPLHHCSAFVATGEATADGGFVMAQSLWMPYFLSPAHAVFVDMIPDNGNRILMEVTAGMIWSGTEWYLNSAGLVVAETTLGTGPYRWGGIPSFVRLRKAVQYADGIDDFVRIMLEDTNGAYCGDYLLADANTNEVAVFEMGSYEYELARTNNGFLPSCNYPWDPEVAEEMGAPQGWDHGCYPRWVRWEQLRDEYFGSITVYDGMRFLGDHYDTVEDRINPCSHTLCGHVENASGYPHGSIDGKVTNRTMASRMETWARYGHSCGQPFLVDVHSSEHPEYAFDDLRDIIPMPYATFAPFSTLSISVLDPGGDPVGGASVFLVSTLDSSTYNASTDADGTAVFDYLPHSDYNITCVTDGYECTDRIIHGGDGHFELILTPTEDRSGFLGGGSSIPYIVAAMALVGIGGIIYYIKKVRR